jgi:hypothetical protein
MLFAEVGEMCRLPNIHQAERRHHPQKRAR